MTTANHVTGNCLSKIKMLVSNIKMMHKLWIYQHGNWRIRGKIIRTILCCVPQLYSTICKCIMWAVLVGLGLVSFCMCFCVFLMRSSLFVTGLVILCFCALFCCCLVVITSTIDCLERLVAEITCYKITYYVLCGMLNSTNSHFDSNIAATSFCLSVCLITCTSNLF